MKAFKIHSLSFKLVGGEDVCQRHHLGLVNGQQVLRNVLRKKKKKQTSSNMTADMSDTKNAKKNPKVSSKRNEA